MPLKVLSVASEAVPLVKTGGLADVAGALPAALDQQGIAVTTLLPGYPAVGAAIGKAKRLHKWDALLGEPAQLLSAKIGAHDLLVLDAPGFFARDGNPYSDSAGKDWDDNWRRFAAFGRAAADIASGAVKKLSFDLVHAHDWQAAMALAYLRFAPFGSGPPVPSVMTIHNMAFQGWYDRKIFGGLELPKKAWSIEGVETYGGVGFLKSGLQLADMVTTVSPTYAREIVRSEFGMGLEGLVASRGDRVRGIVNGIDTKEWDPQSDPALAANYTARSLSKRKANKRALEEHFGLEKSDGPLFIMVTRLTWQKGADVIPEVLDHLVGNGGRLALLGSGDAEIVDALKAGAARHPGKVGLHFGYDEALSHQMQGGGDAILVPSRFEPCGLTQLYGLAYGCVPVVSRTGGLSDTVIDANPAALAAGVATGVQFDGVHYHALASAISRTVELYRQPKLWQKIQRNGMGADFSWARSGAEYAAIYRQLTGEKA
ncbi:glycogen synthase GlgA [Aurantiacibacter marinus]|uniref:Glycogen synthase n=1 Tax=Aurantiacibacter marinus TaxID=874156 RepID=A0A0H0XJY7_9SPHN|nr:glycogen synthase GlgA [Aurantiacibacter marinus]KLI62898.1 glycogen synthase [Aurantiacibacter marinus]